MMNIKLPSFLKPCTLGLLGVLFVQLTLAQALISDKVLPISKQVIPDLEAVVSWSNNKNNQTNSIDPMWLVPVELACKDKHLYPTHPQQDSKIYHISKLVHYDHFKLTAESEVCNIRAKFKRSSDKFSCLRAESIAYVVMSDTYRDSCGNIYRAFWDMAFLEKLQDTMGTFFSRGRTLFQNDMYVAETYALTESDFLFLTKSFNGDLEKIQRLVDKSARTHFYEKRTYLFYPIPEMINNQ